MTFINHNLPQNTDQILGSARATSVSASAQVSDQDIVLALMGRKDLNPQQWLNALSKVLKETTSQNELGELKGKKFSELAKMYSVRFGLNITSPSELIVALWIQNDRLAGLKQNSPLQNFKDILGGATLKEAITRASGLMQGQYPFEQEGLVLALYLAKTAKPGELLGDYTKGESVATLTKAAEESGLNLSEVAAALLHAKENNTTLANAIVFIRYLKDHPEKKQDPKAAYAEMVALLSKGVGDIITESPATAESAISPERLYLKHLETTQELKLKFRPKNNVQEVIDEVYAWTDKLNQKIITQAKAEDKERQEDIAQVNTAVRIAKDTDQKIGLLRSSGASESEISDVKKDQYLEQKRQELLKLSARPTGISYQC